jgi:hypothetical protein
VWQDTILTLCYDRPSGILSVKSRLPPILDPNGCYSYTDIIDRVCSICLDFCRQKLFAEDDEPISSENALQLVRKIEEIPAKAQPHLLSTVNCFTIRQHVEYYVVVIYVNHGSASILQSTLPEASIGHSQDEVKRQICETSMSKSASVVEDFIKLRQVSILSSHYWSLLQASVTAVKFIASRVHADDGSKASSLVKALITSLYSSCDETISVVNGFSTSLSQTVADLTVILEN